MKKKMTYKEANKRYHLAISRATEQYHKDIIMAETKLDKAHDMAAKERMKIKSKNGKLI